MTDDIIERIRKAIAEARRKHQAVTDRKDTEVETLHRGRA